MAHIFFPFSLLTSTLLFVITFQILPGNKSYSAYRELKLKHNQIITQVFVKPGFSITKFLFVYSLSNRGIKKKKHSFYYYAPFLFFTNYIDFSCHYTVLSLPIRPYMQPSQSALLKIHSSFRAFLTTLPIQVFQV